MAADANTFACVHPEFSFTSLSCIYHALCLVILVGRLERILPRWMVFLVCSGGGATCRIARIAHHRGHISTNRVYPILACSSVAA